MEIGSQLSPNKNALIKVMTIHKDKVGKISLSAICKFDHTAFHDKRQARRIY